MTLDEGDRSLLFTGDLRHTPAQVGDPERPFNHDMDPDEASRSRIRLVRQALAQGWTVAVSHFARPFGRVEASGWVGGPSPKG